MSLGSSLLRLLLCIALAFNGVSTARAGMHLEHALPADTMQSAAPDAMENMVGMPCHDMDQGGNADPSTATDPGPDEGKGPTPDCCKGGCQCACMHATPAIAAVAFPALVVHVAVEQRGVIVHAPPAALRLNRPPIG